MTATMTETTPDERNKFAFILGRVFHPYLICIPSVFLVLSDLGLEPALRWSALVLGMVLIPGICASAYVSARHKRYLHQRSTRGPLYFIGWVSVLACWAVLSWLDAPRVLIAGMVALAVWLPLQMGINQFITKVSAHAAVLTGCLISLFLIGKLTEPLPLALAITIALLTMWARIVTKHHTLGQVILGAVVGALPILLVFPRML